MLALIGPNGAGKSTTFNMVGGQLRPDAGDVRLAGESLVGLPPRTIWRRGVGRTFQIAETFRSLTVVENVQMALLSARPAHPALVAAAPPPTGGPMRWPCWSAWACTPRPTAPAAPWPMAM